VAFLRRDPQWRRVAVAAILSVVVIVAASETIPNPAVTDAVIVLVALALLLFLRRSVSRH
jgi:hypothetical protein